ncbi:hypothetical protein B0H66DRAFT_306918 [Apodospora peruviana]|uniref:C2H2-type domain-containing protein n=1 Tax=Apodospora peruviana TaxID=516989 RepID=A0AAE0I2B7_9PEZI|nr:hypothetical protein B0H66DRAFT_306918 [Apodospora peruviana]
MSTNIFPDQDSFAGQAATEQDELIWVPIRIPKASSRSLPGNYSPADSQPFYQNRNPMMMQDTFGAYLPPVSLSPYTMMTTPYLSSSAEAASLPVDSPVMDWSSSELPIGGSFDAALDLELQAYLDAASHGEQQPVAASPDLFTDSPGLFSGLDLSDDALLGLLPELGLETDTYPGLGYNSSPVNGATSWNSTDYAYSPSTHSSPVTSLSSPVAAPASSVSTTSTPSSSVSSPFLMCPEAECSQVIFTRPTDLRYVQSNRLLGRNEQEANCPGHNRKHSREHHHQHQQRRHRQKSPRQDASGGGGGSFRCPVCTKPHLDNRALSRHLWAKHPDFACRTNTKSERAQCHLCEYSGRADNLARHMKRHAK